MWRFLSAFLSFLSRVFTRPLPPQPEDDLPHAKVAIIGAGIGGCFAAKFLRENGGKKLDIHVFAKKGSEIGGRTAVCQFDGHVYETGAAIIHTDNKYLVDAAKQHELTIRKENDTVPYGIFSGESMFRIRMNKITQFIQMLWRYGFDLFRMNRFLSGLLKKFRTIYAFQRNGMAYANVEDMLRAIGGQKMSGLMKVSAYDYMRNVLNWNETVIDELITAALRVNYGQSTSVNAFVAAVALAGGQDGSLWRVVGGNYKIAECVLKDSGSSLVMEDVISVTRTEEDGSVKYTVTTVDGKTDGYDVVIVANPLNTSATKYDNFTNDVYTAAATTPYQRTVATFYKGKINQQFFGEAADLANFPQFILTTDMQSPFNFNSINVEVPSEIEQDEVAKYEVPLQDDPVRVWKVLSPQPLTQDQCLSLFPKIDPDDSACYDWLAYPQYIAPYQAPSFILDDGVFYINAIEMAASAMEMSAIGAKNAALLARDYLFKIHGTDHKD